MPLALGGSERKRHPAWLSPGFRSGAGRSAAGGQHVEAGPVGPAFALGDADMEEVIPAAEEGHFLIARRIVVDRPAMLVMVAIDHRAVLQPVEAERAEMEIATPAI